METRANLANSQAAQSDVLRFIAWAEKRQELTKEEKERLAKLVADFQKSRGIGYKITGDELGLLMSTDVP